MVKLIRTKARKSCCLRARMSDMVNHRKISRNRTRNKLFACCVISERNSFVEALTTMPEIWQNSGMTLPRGQSIYNLYRKKLIVSLIFCHFIFGFSVFRIRFPVLQERTCAACSFACPGCGSKSCCWSHERKGLQDRKIENESQGD